MNSRSPISNGYVRWAAAVFVTAVVFALGGIVATNVINRGMWEQATIGLTSESAWPLHDVHLATTAGALDDPGLVASIRLDLELGDDAWVELDRQRQAGNGVVTVAARASNAADAAALANAVAEEMVARVRPETPVRVVDRADGTQVRSTNKAIAGSGALIGFLVGLVVWEAPGRRNLQDEQS